ncbi:hypothetical protein F5Y16DRAFT_400869 [Xylariaceae sp. FL0255]|nr:hypothetical protein F5Y16DRAFT_400869 [Xylariaceae sp. FL0255]
MQSITIFLLTIASSMPLVIADAGSAAIQRCDGIPDRTFFCELAAFDGGQWVAECIDDWAYGLWSCTDNGTVCDYALSSLGYGQVSQQYEVPMSAVAIAKNASLLHSSSS